MNTVQRMYRNRGMWDTENLGQQGWPDMFWSGFTLSSFLNSYPISTHDPPNLSLETLLQDQNSCLDVYKGKQVPKTMS